MLSRALFYEFLGTMATVYAFNFIGDFGWAMVYF